MQDNSNNKNDYNPFPFAAFTFGRESDQKYFQMVTKPNKEETEINQKVAESEKENSKDNNNDKDDKIVYSLPFSFETRQNMKKKEKASYSTFINKIGSHNSFLSVILHMIYNMKPLRNFIINELSELREKDQKTKMLFYLRNIILKYSENQKIELNQMRLCLAELFQNKRKFLLEHPDDPCDCYFALINSIHSFYIQLPLNEIRDISCRDKCFVHRNLWIDLAQIEECECKGISKRLYSNFNYIFDIPMDAIFELIKTTIIITNDNNAPSNHQDIKIKERSVSQIPYSMNDIKGKLFYYFKLLLNKIKINCPVKGNRCNVNITNKKLIINNNPKYLVFSLLQKSKNSTSYFSSSIIDILRSFILLPQKFELSQLCEYSQNYKNSYHSQPLFSLIGCVFAKNSRVYTNVCRLNRGWVYFDDSNAINFNPWCELISHCLKKGEIPIMAFYKLEEEKDSSNKDNEGVLTEESIITLERYAINADNIGKIIQNKLRIIEETLPPPQQKESEKNKNPFIKKENVNNINNSNIIHRNVGYNENSNNNKYYEYFCYNCQWKNKLNNKNCVKCRADNSNIIHKLFKPRTSDEKKSENTNIIEKEKIKNKFTQDYKKHQPKEKEIEQKQRKYFDLPRQYIPKKEVPITIKNPTQNQNPPSFISPHKDIQDLRKLRDNRVTSNSEIRTRTYQNDIKSQKHKFPMREQYPNNLNANIPLFSLSPDYIWYCSNCKTVNKDYEYKCKICNLPKKNIHSSNRLHTPNIHHNKKSEEKRPDTGLIHNHQHCSFEKRYNFSNAPNSNEIEGYYHNIQDVISQSNRRKNLNGIYYATREKNQVKKMENLDRITKLNVNIHMSTEVERHSQGLKNSNSQKRHFGNK